jgi:arylamine N-acetyltransferase
VLNETLTRRYLGILGVERRPPSLESLTELVSAQLIRAPFENLSKLYLHRVEGATTIPTLEGYLDGIEGWRLGGTCYANNFYFFTLLTSLGYDTRLCGADMSKPDVHLVIMVRVEGREYLVDVGYAAPFYRPLPRDRDADHIIDFGRCRYVLRTQDETGSSRLELMRDGKPIHGYLAKPEPRTVDEFVGVIRGSYRADSTFMNAVVIERFSPSGSTRIHNLKITRTEIGGDSDSTELDDLDELIDVIRERMGVPERVTARALDGIDLEADIYS